MTASDPPSPGLAALAERIGYRFVDWSLLERSLAHRSWCAETPGAISNERLEFLGDAVLGWAIADLVYHRYPVAEGQLTDLRKSVVNAIALAEVAQVIGLGEHVLLGRGESAAGGSDKPSILSDAFEAVLGAVYLDGGAEAAYEMVERLVVPRMPDSADSMGQFDQKTQLQELSARLGRGAPVYELSSNGPDHAKTFHARVLVDGEVLGVGTGRSKKAAEQLAATEACLALG
ncbi:MAG TPA: ribonuclease III [Ilumatobacteraceae bacterium]|nr:ribonuclease III [Ilumatobacteraceae bacterium]